jgi:hypothetical protein
MRVRLEIDGDTLLCRTGAGLVVGAPLRDVLAAAARRADAEALPDAIPDGVRFIRRRGHVEVVVLEEPPAVRTVRWLRDDSPAPFGPRATYRTARLAFPYVVMVLGFSGGSLTERGQCFYRVAPLRHQTDPLLLPNLRNVAHAHGQLAWVCLRKIGAELTGLPWVDKVRLIRAHFWQAGFNGSCPVSYWQAMRDVDARVDSIAAWEEASERDRFFPLSVAWRAAGVTVGGVIDETLHALGPPGPPGHAEEMISLVTELARPVRPRQARVPWPGVPGGARARRP